METSLKLYGYWRSSAAYRVRICLNLKQLRYENHSIHLVKNGGEQHLAHYHALNPNELVPVLVDGDLVLNQSLAIIQYLDDNYSSTQVIPSMGPLRYQALALAQDIAIDVHPLNNLRVLQYLEGSLEVDEEQKRLWVHHWIHMGFKAVEEKLLAHRKHYGECVFSVSSSPSIVDICLVPQVYNALRFGVNMAPYPTINAVVAACNQLPAFDLAKPENQPDAQL
ncbi:maleylacetoacetate isomerase [Vibrio vulnificus]